MAYYAELNVYLDSSGAGSSNNRPKKVKQPKEKKVNSLKATAITAIADRAMLAYRMYSDPVFTVNITGASSISSSPGTLFPGVESLSGIP